MMILWMYFQARHCRCIKSLKKELRVENATQEVFNSFFIIPHAHCLAELSQMDCVQSCHRHILQFSSGLSCTEEFPLQLTVLNALPLLWKSSFCLWDDQDNRIFVMGIFLQSRCFSYLWLLLCCTDSGVSTDSGRMQKDAVGQRQSVVCVEWVSSGKISPGKDPGPGSAGRTDYAWCLKIGPLCCKIFQESIYRLPQGWTLMSQLLETFS